MNILGIIPARGGSKELPNKNLLKIGGKSLVELAIRSSRESKLLTRTILSSDSKKIIDEAKKFSCEVPFRRPSKLATDSASTFSVLIHSVEWLEKNKNWKTDIVVLLQPTTPFRAGHHIDGVIKLLFSSKADAAITVTKPSYSPYWMVKLEKDNQIKSLIKDGNKFIRRQDTPEVYQPAGMVYAFKKEILYKMKNTLLPFQDTRGFVIKKEEAINIDTRFDYETAISINNKNKIV